MCLQVNGIDITKATTDEFFTLTISNKYKDPKKLIKIHYSFDGDDALSNTGRSAI